MEGLPSVPALRYDSRAVRPGDCFVAVPGTKADGRGFIADALARGAAAVVAEDVSGVPEGVATMQVPDARRALSRLSAQFYGDPSRALKAVGITGTKGKTTTSYLLESILSAAGEVPGVIGTVTYRWPGAEVEAGRTTPESLDLQRMLSEMKAAGATAAVLEVSSHALVLSRTADVAFRVGLFTNLASDHLDYHKTVEAYRDAKGILFRDLEPGAVAVLNADDPASAVYRALTPAKVLAYAMDAKADCVAEVLEAAWDHTRVMFRTPVAAFEARLAFVGRHNVMNALAAAAAGTALGLDPGAIRKGLESLTRVPGRLDRVPCALPFRVFVDYAHTEDSLRNLLTAARAFTKARILLAFGCGGDRDRSKRPRMGAVAQEMADVVVVTSDNPRSEAPEAILKEIAAGMNGGKPYRVIEDRAAAIRALLAEAREGDTVLIAGKGHERGQILKDHTVPFDDLEEARAAVAALGG